MVYVVVSGELYGKVVDIWVFGVIFYCMLIGILFFNYLNIIELYVVVVERRYVYVIELIIMYRICS